MNAARRVSSLSVAGIGAVLLASVGLGASPAVAVPVAPCADTYTNLSLAVGITLSCAISGPPATDNDPALNTRTYFTSIDLNAEGITPQVVVANDMIFQPVSSDTSTPQDTVDEVVSSMVQRTGGTVGINGGYFDIFQGGKTPYTGSVCGGIVIDGETWKSPPIGTDPDQTAQIDTALYVDSGGAMHIDHVGFTGSVTLLDDDDSVPPVTKPLAAVNDITSALPVPRCPAAYLPGPSTGEDITLLTPRLGPALLNPGPDGSPGFSVPTSRKVTWAAATPVPGEDGAFRLDSVSITDGITALPQVPDGQVVLLGSGSDTTTPGGWLSTLKPGQKVRIDQALTVDGQPVSNIVSLTGGVAQIVAGGMLVNPVVGFVPPSGTGEAKHAETVIALDGTGRQVTLLTIDRTDGSPGVWWQQAAQLAAASGAQTAILLDGGGSTTLAAALPDQDGTVTVVNTPEGDNDLSGPSGQRFVGSGLIFTGTALPPAPVTSPTPDPTPPAPILPATGSSPFTAALAGAGAVLIALGVTLSRRRPNRKSHPRS